jgi:hypothetical protein
MIYWSIYFVWITRYSVYFLAFGVLMNFITAILCFFIPESPKYLFGKEKFDECRKSLATVASRNGVVDYHPPKFAIEDELLIEIDDEDELAMLHKERSTMKMKESILDEKFDHLLVGNNTDNHGGKTEVGIRATRMTKKTVVDAVQAHIRATRAGEVSSRYTSMAA